MRLKLLLMITCIAFLESNMLAQSKKYRKVSNTKFKKIVNDEDRKRYYLLGQDGLIYSLKRDQNKPIAVAKAITNKPVQDFILYKKKLMLVVNGRVVEMDLATKKTKSTPLGSRATGSVKSIHERYKYSATNPDSVTFSSFQLITNAGLVDVAEAGGSYITKIYILSAAMRKERARSALFAYGLNVVLNNGKYYAINKIKPTLKKSGNFRLMTYNPASLTFKSTFTSPSEVRLLKSIRGKYYKYNSKTKKIEQGTSTNPSNVQWTNQFLPFELPSKKGIRDYTLTTKNSRLFIIDVDGYLWEEIDPNASNSGSNANNSGSNSGNNSGSNANNSGSNSGNNSGSNANNSGSSSGSNSHLITKLLTYKNKIFGLGSDGYIYTYSTQAHKFVRNNRYPQKAKDITEPTSKYSELVFLGEDGKLYHYNIRTRKVEQL